MKRKFNGDRLRAELKKPLNLIMWICFVIYLSIFITNQFTVAGPIMDFIGTVAFITYFVCICITYSRMRNQRRKNI